MIDRNDPKLKYHVKNMPDAIFLSGVGNKISPILFLENGYGQIFVIYTDDHCFVLGSVNSGSNEFEKTGKDKVTYNVLTVYYWFPEAIEAVSNHLKTIQEGEDLLKS